LQQKLYTLLQPTDMVLSLHVLAILHIAVCIPKWWIVGNAKDLAKYDFGCYTMGTMCRRWQPATWCWMKPPW
jgi:hypothetical protein